MAIIYDSSVPMEWYAPANAQLCCRLISYFSEACFAVKSANKFAHSAWALLICSFCSQKLIFRAFLDVGLRYALLGGEVRKQRQCSTKVRNTKREGSASSFSKPGLWQLGQLSIASTK